MKIHQTRSMVYVVNLRSEIYVESSVQLTSSYDGKWSKVSVIIAGYTPHMMATKCLGMLTASLCPNTVAEQLTVGNKLVLCRFTTIYTEIRSAVSEPALNKQ